MLSLGLQLKLMCMFPPSYWTSPCECFAFLFCFAFHHALLTNVLLVPSRTVLHIYYRRSWGWNLHRCISKISPLPTCSFSRCSFNLLENPCINGTLMALSRVRVVFILFALLCLRSIFVRSVSGEYIVSSLNRLVISYEHTRISEKSSFLFFIFFKSA